MRPYEQTTQVRDRIAAARLAAPKGPMTAAALGMQQGLYYLLLPQLLIAPPVQLAVRLLNHRDFKLLLIPFKAVWWLGAGFLVTSSLFWMGGTLRRFPLLLPGVLISRLCYIYQACTPKGIDASRDLKLAMCDLWPLTWLVLTGPGTAAADPASGATSGVVVVEGEVIGRGAE